MTLLIVNFCAPRMRKQEPPRRCLAEGLSAFRSCSTARRSVSALGWAASNPNVPNQASFVSKGGQQASRARYLIEKPPFARGAENQYLHIRINVILLCAYFPFDFLDYRINLSLVPTFDSR